MKKNIEVNAVEFLIFFFFFFFSPFFYDALEWRDERVG